MFRVTSYVLVRGGERTRSLFNHPSRNPLRELIWSHEGPWGEDDVAALNEMGFGRLRFAAKNGQLHVSVED